MELGVLGVDVELPADRDRHSLAQAQLRLPPKRGWTHGLGLVEVPLQQRASQRLLVRKVLIERADADPGHFGDAIGVRAIQAVLDKNASRRGQDIVHERPRARLLRNFTLQYLGVRGQWALTYVSWDGRWQIAWLLEKGEWREMKKRDWLAACAALMPEPTAQHLLAHRNDLEGPILLDVIVGRCARWHLPGVLLLGAAAHPMSPIRAQGINMALRDAIVAANHLVPAVREGRDIEAACADLQRERDREIIKVQKLQLRDVQGQRWAREKPWLMRPMLRLAPAIARLPFIEPMWFWQQKPMRFGVTEVELQV